MSTTSPHFNARIYLIGFDDPFDYYIAREEADRIERLLLSTDSRLPEEFLEFGDLYRRVMFVRNEVIAYCQLFFEESDPTEPAKSIDAFRFYLRGIAKPIESWFDDGEAADDFLFALSTPSYEPDEYIQYIDGDGERNLVRPQDILLVEVPRTDREMWQEYMAKEVADNAAATH